MSSYPDRTAVIFNFVLSTCMHMYVQFMKRPKVNSLEMRTSRGLDWENVQAKSAFLHSFFQQILEYFQVKNI